MKNLLRLPLSLLVCGLISACGLMGGNGSAGLTPAAQAAPAAKANAFNPWMNKSLPNTRTLSAEGLAMVQAMGADRQSIEDEAAHRPHWREEIYPVFFGNRTAPHEIIVLLDFAAPDSARVWQAVRDASARLSPADVKIAVFAKNSENYGTDLMGMGIWISYERKGQAMDYMSHALSEWNRIKAAQKKQGRSVPFTNEYDATVTSTDLPIHYAFMGKLRPAVPSSQELDVARYCYNAGNVNMYQAVQISRYYGVKRIPAVIVDGRVLASPFGPGHRVRPALGALSPHFEGQASRMPGPVLFLSAAACGTGHATAGPRAPSRHRPCRIAPPHRCRGPGRPDRAPLPGTLLCRAPAGPALRTGTAPVAHRADLG